MSIIQGRLGGDTVATSVRLPRDLREEIKKQAIRAGRSLNTHVVMLLRAAAGEEIGVKAPAAETDNAARQSGPSINQGYGEASDE